MPNSNPRRNAKYLNNAPLCQTFTRKNNPLDSTKTHKKEAPALGVADTPIDEVLDVRHMPSRAAGGANAACIKGGGDPAQIGYSSLADCFDDWQRIRGEQRGILGLGYPAKCSGIWGIAPVAQ